MADSPNAQIRRSRVTADPARTEAAVERGGVASDETRTPALLRVRNFRSWIVTARGHVRAVDGVDLDLAAGETLGIVGESGSGKTVLSRSIMGLTQQNVVRSGEVTFRGTDLLSLGRKDMRRLLGEQIAMVFQDPMTSLNPVMKIGTQLTEAVRLRRSMSRRQARAVAIDLLAAVHIPDPERSVNQYPHQLSGGMRQRVMIAIAISCGPSLVFADEPTTSLDVTVQAQILDLLEEQQRERNMAMVLVTHDLGVVANRTDRIAVMYAGKVVETGPTSTLFTETRMPYTEALLQSVPRLDDDAPERLKAIPGRPPDLLAPPAGCRFAARCSYAQDICHDVEPPLQEADAAGHLYACWFPLGIARPNRTPPASGRLHLPPPSATPTGHWGD